MDYVVRSWHIPLFLPIRSENGTFRGVSLLWTRGSAFRLYGYILPCRRLGYFVQFIIDTRGPKFTPMISLKYKVKQCEVIRCQFWEKQEANLVMASLEWLL